MSEREGGRDGEGALNSCSRLEHPERALISPGRGSIREKLPVVKTTKKKNDGTHHIYRAVCHKV